LRYLNSYMRRDAERAIRVRDVANWMGVNSLDRPSRQNQQDTKQREKDSPRTLHMRFWSMPEHDKSNIAQDLSHQNVATQLLVHSKDKSLP